MTCYSDVIVKREKKIHQLSLLLKNPLIYMNPLRASSSSSSSSCSTSNASASSSRSLRTSRSKKQSRISHRSRGVVASDARTKDADDDAPEKSASSRRNFLSCACAFCCCHATSRTTANAFPRLVELNREGMDVQYVLDHRNEGTDKVFAKASAFFFLSPHLLTVN